MEDQLEEMTPNKVRPTFLTVICILTFIGSGWGIISGITNYVSADTVGETKVQMEEAMDDAMDDMDDAEMSEEQLEMVENIIGGFTESITPDNIRNGALVSIFSCLLTLAGAILMWNLNKKGFYLYILGIAILIVGMVLVYGGLMGAITAVGSGFFGVVFIILYGVNLKEMN